MRVADENRFHALPAQLDQRQQAAFNLVVEYSRTQHEKAAAEQNNDENATA